MEKTTTRAPRIGVMGGTFANGGSYYTESLNNQQCTASKDCAVTMFNKLKADKARMYNTSVYQSKGKV